MKKIIPSLAAGLFLGIYLQGYLLIDKEAVQIEELGPSIYSPPPAAALVADRPDSITLVTRNFKASSDIGNYDTEKDSKYEYESQKLELNKMALVLIDVWEVETNDGYLQRRNENINSKLLPLLELARKYGIKVIHAPHGKEMAKIIVPLKNEFTVVGSTEEEHTKNLDQYLKNNNINTLLYAGYAVNMCLLDRPTGIIKMRQLGYGAILVKDCTIAFETPESLSGQWAYKMAVNRIESIWGSSTTTLDDLQTALEKK